MYPGMQFIGNVGYGSHLKINRAGIAVWRDTKPIIIELDPYVQFTTQASGISKAQLRFIVILTSKIICLQTKASLPGR